jgi:hypothetical protein
VPALARHGVEHQRAVVIRRPTVISEPRLALGTVVRRWLLGAAAAWIDLPLQWRRGSRRWQASTRSAAC